MNRCWLLPLVAVFAAVAYWLRWDVGSSAVLIAWKMTPALAMAFSVWWQRHRAACPLVVALLLHSAGDGLLALGGSWFLAGMAAFFVGHLGYIAAFFPYRYERNALPIPRRLTIALLIIALIGLTIYIQPFLSGPLAVASPAYAAALTAMAVFALLGRWRGPWVVMGALLFVLSDVALGLDLFAHQAALSAIVWPTYVAAQILIPLGYLQTVSSCHEAKEI